MRLYVHFGTMRSFMLYGLILGILLVGDPQRSEADDPKRDLETLILGGSFDDVLYDNGLPPEWTVLPREFVGIDCYTTTADYRSGPRGLRFSSNQEWAHVCPRQHPWVTDTLQVVRAWVKLEPESTGEVTLIVNYMDPTGKSVGRIQSGGHRDGGVLTAEAARRGSPWKLISLDARGDKFQNVTHYELFAVQKNRVIAIWDDFEVKSIPMPKDKSLLANGSFERVVGDDFARWNFVASEDSQVEVSPETENPFQGWVALHLSGEAKSYTFVSSPIAVVATKTYRLTGQHRSNHGTGHLNFVIWKDAERLRTLTTQHVAEKTWASMEELVASPEATQGATHLTVEYETSGKFDLFVDWLRVKDQ